MARRPLPPGTHTTHHSPITDAPFDFDPLLRANLERVFHERDDTKRALAMNELLTEAPVMYERDRPVQGQDAISRVAGDLLKQFGPTFRFRADGVGLGHHGMAPLRWTAGEADLPATVPGFDTAEIVEGRIARLWVLIEPPLARQAGLLNGNAGLLQ